MAEWCSYGSVGKPRGSTHDRIGSLTGNGNRKAAWQTSDCGWFAEGKEAVMMLCQIWRHDCITHTHNCKVKHSYTSKGPIQSIHLKRPRKSTAKTDPRGRSSHPPQPEESENHMRLKRLLFLAFSCDKLIVQLNIADSAGVRVSSACCRTTTADCRENVWPSAFRK